MQPENYGVGQSTVMQNFSGVGIAPQLYRFMVEDVTAGADIAARLLAGVPAGYNLNVLQADIISNGSPAGIDNSNTCVVSLLNGTNAIVTKTYNTATEFPAADTLESLGALSATYQKIAADGTLKFSLTNGATANSPAFVLQLLCSLDQAF